MFTDNQEEKRLDDERREDVNRCKCFLEEEF